MNLSFDEICQTEAQKILQAKKGPKSKHLAFYKSIKKANIIYDQMLGGLIREANEIMGPSETRVIFIEKYFSADKKIVLGTSQFID